MLGTNNSNNYEFTINNHTDSGYINISYIINKIKQKKGEFSSTKDMLDTVDSVCVKFIEPRIQEAINDICYTFNVFDDTVLDMEKETLSDGVVVVANGKYYCRYYKEKDGVYKPSHKIVGLSLIGKSTPPYCKEKLTPVLDLILDKDSKELVSYIDTVEKEFKLQPISSISVIKGVSSLDYSDKNFKKIKDGKSLTAPIHSRGSIIHNTLVTNKNLNYPHIVEGDNVYYTYLTLPNPIMSDVISYINPKFMEDSGLLPYVDYATMFEKNFKKNIALITEPIGWSLNAYQGAMDDWC